MSKDTRQIDPLKRITRSKSLGVRFMLDVSLSACEREVRSGRSLHASAATAT